MSGRAIGPRSFASWGSAFNLAIGLLLFSLVTAGGWPNAVRGAERKTKAESGDHDDPPEPKDITLHTNDGVDLRATYFSGTEKRTEDGKYREKDEEEKETTVPIIMVHGTKGSRRDFDSLASTLQQQGHAVIVPDLRGQGDNTHFNPRPEDYDLMVAQDLEAAKRFLIEKNNKKELNIESLCIVGAGSGAALALNYALVDWSFEALATVKQGQDVKALVLISPEMSVKGASVKKALADVNVRANLSVLVMVGKKSQKAMKEAKLVHGAFERYHPLPPEDERKEKQDLFLQTPDTNLQGAKLLNEESLQPALNGQDRKVYRVAAGEEAFSLGRAEKPAGIAAWPRGACRAAAASILRSPQRVTGYRNQGPVLFLAVGRCLFAISSCLADRLLLARRYFQNRANRQQVRTGENRSIRFVNLEVAIAASQVLAGQLHERIPVHDRVEPGGRLFARRQSGGGSIGVGRGQIRLRKRI